MFQRNKDLRRGSFKVHQNELISTSTWLSSKTNVIERDIEQISPDMTAVSSLLSSRVALLPCSVPWSFFDLHCLPSRVFKTGFYLKLPIIACWSSPRYIFWKDVHSSSVVLGVSQVMLDYPDCGPMGVHENMSFADTKRGWSMFKVLLHIQKDWTFESLVLLLGLV